MHEVAGRKSRDLADMQADCTLDQNAGMNYEALDSHNDPEYLWETEG